MLRSGMHVSEQALQRSSTERNGTRGFVHESSNLLRRPGGIRQCQPYQRVLSKRQLISAKDRFGGFGPDFVYECPCCPKRCFGVSKVFLESVAVENGSRTAYFRSDDRRKLIEHPPGDPAGPAGMTDQG